MFLSSNGIIIIYNNTISEYYSRFFVQVPYTNWLISVVEQKCELGNVSVQKDVVMVVYVDNKCRRNFLFDCSVVCISYSPFYCTFCPVLLTLKYQSVISRIINNPSKTDDIAMRSLL